MYVKHGDCLFPTSKANLDIHETLGDGVYEVKFDKDKNSFYFQVSPEFKIPPKLYGDFSETADRILNTYGKREGTTGALLSGLKGSGKSMLAKLVSARAKASLGIPTILVGQAFSGPAFCNVIRDIPKSVIIFDEFEKMYNDEENEQDGLLSLFDGVFTSHSLILVTCNNEWRVSEYFKNRPGRIFYTLEFDGLDQAFVKDYCEDKLENKENTSQVLDITGLASNYSFDMLQALVEEMNRYKETAPQALKYLNFKAFTDSDTYFDVKVTYNGESFKASLLRGFPLFIEPLVVSFPSNGPKPEFSIKVDNALINAANLSKAVSNSSRLKVESPAYDDSDEDCPSPKQSSSMFILDKSMLISKDNASRTYTYRHPNGAVVVYSPHLISSNNYIDVI
jgi:hypothetical protein